MELHKFHTEGITAHDLKCVQKEELKRLKIESVPYQELENKFKAWMEALGYKELTKKAMGSCVREFLYCMEQRGLMEVKKISSQDIMQHYEYLRQRSNQRRGGGLSESIIGKHLQAIRLLFQYQEQLQKIKENPMSGLHFSAPKSKSRLILSQPEVNQLYDTAESYRDKALLGAFYGCGLRRSEVEKLNANDINYSSSLLYVREGKGKKRRVIPMNAKVKEDLENYYFYERVTKNPEESFFINRKGTRMRDQSFAVWFTKLKDKAGIGKDVCLHSLRHSIATHLLENGVKVEYVRDFLGHQFLETTKIYTRVSAKQLTTHF